VLCAAGARDTQALSGPDLEAAEAVAGARCFRQLGEDWLAREVGSRHLTWVQLLQACLLGAGGGRVDALVGGAAIARLQLLVVAAWILARLRRDLGGQQVQNDAVLVSGPHAAVVAQERSAGALFAAEAEARVEQSIDEVLEADGHIVEPASKALRHPVDHAARDGRLADGGT